jgi:hypothetical protein
LDLEYYRFRSKGQLVGVAFSADGTFAGAERADPLHRAD